LKALTRSQGAVASSSSSSSSPLVRQNDVRIRNLSDEEEERDTACSTLL
jgi:hypothetical protein